MTYLQGLARVCTIIFLLILVSTQAFPVTPDIVHPADRDFDMNRIEDALDAKIRGAVSGADPEKTIPIIVTLYLSPSDDDIEAFKRLGGVVTHVYRTATYGYAGSLSASRIGELASGLAGKLCIIENDLPGRGTLDDSARHIRVRPLVWDTTSGYNLHGDPDIVIAIMDTGIDETHTDLSGGRVVFWNDYTSESEASSTDRNGHGTHVAGIAAGTGASAGSGAASSLTTTMSGKLPPSSPDGLVDMIKVPVLGNGQVTSNLTWQGSGTGQINLARSTPGWFTGVTGTFPPISTAWNIFSTDVYKARAGNELNLGNQPFSMLVTYPYSGVGDGFNLFRGVAPACNLAGFKILRQDGTNPLAASDWTAAFDSLARVNVTYNIKVANASVNLDNGAANTALRTAANSCVAAGTVVVISAGNDFSAPVRYPIADPGLADKAITVGAINDFGAMTHYSSNGPAISTKPDVVAPGGSHSWNSNVGSEITSDDTNVNDAHTTGFADRQVNDYSNLFGTSMATPHVAGVVALVIEALEKQGQTWRFVENEVLKVKMLIQMTATETNRLGEENSGNNPPLNRGGKDRTEGYGKINADAAVEAVINASLTAPPDTTFPITFGSGAFDRQCWASPVGFCGPGRFTMTLAVPPGADYDLYLYKTQYTGNGEPDIAQSSTQSGVAVDESITVGYGLFCSGFYLVAKRVSGSGAATMTIEQISTASVLVHGLRASVLDEGVEVVWSISGEVSGFEGFNVYRGEDGNGARRRLNESMISGDAPLRFLDRTANPNHSYHYWVGVSDDDGEVLYGPAEVIMPSIEIALEQNVPNPFNPGTVIKFVIPVRAHVSLSVYDARGRLVVVLVDEIFPEGPKEIRWNGRNASGAPVSSGVYFYTLRAGKKTLTKKMILLR